MVKNPGSPTIEPPFLELATDGASWNCRTLCLKVSLNLFGGSSRCFLHHSNNPSLQSAIKFSLEATSREVGDSALGLELPDNIVYDGHRNIKVSNDGLVALRLSMLGDNLVSDLLRQFSGFLSFLHAHCGLKWHKTAEWLIFSIKTGWMSDIHITGTCTSPQVSSIPKWRRITCLKRNYF